VFAAESATEVGFQMPFDGNAGKALGPLQRIRRDSAPSGRSSMSEDGRLLAFPKYEFASGSLWVRDLRTGEERQLAATPRTPLNPVVSVDGRLVGYTVTSTETGGASGPGTGFVIDSSGGVPRKVCDNCEVALFSRDNQQVIFGGPSRTTLFRMDMRTSVQTPFVTSSRGPVDRPMISPNGAWFTFNLPDGVYLAPLHSDRAPTDAEWTRVLETTSAGRTAGMSPDGSLLYVLLERDGFRCLYALKLDPATGRPRSEPYVVAHFHDQSRRWGTTGLGSAVAANLFVASLSETTGNIWMTTIGPSTEAK
jgi:Tol biopolymer transport system component